MGGLSGCGVAAVDGAAFRRARIAAVTRPFLVHERALRSDPGSGGNTLGRAALAVEFLSGPL